MEAQRLETALAAQKYPGRGIIVGKSEDGTCAAAAYFITGRSENSRNRIFVRDGEGIRTEAFNPAKLTDARLIIYPPVRVLGAHTIISNGSHTDDIFNALEREETFLQVWQTFTFEPDAPHYTPRIAALITIADSAPHFELAIAKTADGTPADCARFIFSFDTLQNGEGRFIHTYQDDGNPLPSFEGEPKRITLKGSLDDFTGAIWKNLNADNKISLFTRFIDLRTGKHETRIVNQHP